MRMCLSQISCLTNLIKRVNPLKQTCQLAEPFPNHFNTFLQPLIPFSMFTT
ncbi:hypothetical protein Hanom_Chr16g01442401 [Helianthus anomalus]